MPTLIKIIIVQFLSLTSSIHMNKLPYIARDTIDLIPDLKMYYLCCLFWSIMLRGILPCFWSHIPRISKLLEPDDSPGSKSLGELSETSRTINCSPFNELFYHHRVTELRKIHCSRINSLTPCN